MSGLFDDGKDDGALRTIGEVGEGLGIKAHVLRYWEDQFPQLQPLKRSGGRRYYRAEDVELLREIDRLVNREGYTLKGARAALKTFRPEAGGRGEGEEPAAGAADTAAQPSPAPRATSPGDTLARLRAIRGRLADAIAS